MQTLERQNTRTLSSIYKALLQIICEKPFQRITVKELCERADVNKSTFYNYFDNMTECRQKWMAYSVKEVFHIGSEIKNLNYLEMIMKPRPYLELILNYLEENMFYFKKLYNSPYYSNYIVEYKHLLVNFITEECGITLEEHKYAYLTLIFFCCGTIDTIFLMINRYDRDILLHALELLLTSCGNVLVNDSKELLSMLSAMQEKNHQ